LITCLTPRRVGQSAIVDTYNDDGMLEQSESLDSDEVRNDDGDEVVDPPGQWIDADDNESLDEKLAAKTSDDPSETGRPRRHTTQLKAGHSTSSATTSWTALTRPSMAGNAAKSTGRWRTATRSSTWKDD
jgi:hypothetical protein